MEIIDAQIHLWGSGLPSNDAHWQITSFNAAEAVAKMDEAGVDGAVIYPPTWDPNSVDLARRAVADYPGRFAYVDQLRVEAGNIDEAIQRVDDEPGLIGLRILLRGENKQRLVAGELDGVWAILAAANVPMSLLLDGTFAEIGAVAGRFPALKLTIDHLGGRGGFETARDAAAMTHIPALLALAVHPNIAVKATGLPHYAGEAHPYPIMQGYLAE